MPSPKALTWSAWVSCVRFLRLRVDPVMTRAIFLSSTSMDTSTRCAPAASWNASAGVMLSSCGCCDGWLRTSRRLRTSGGRTGRESWGRAGHSYCSAASRDCSLPDLDATDATEIDDADAERTTAALVELKARRAELAALAAMLEAEHRTTLVEGEPDARSMGMGAGRKPPSYNVQAAVDVETSLIVHHEVTTEPTDNRLLYPMARATKEAVEADTLTVVADAGYSNGADAAACERDGITPCVPANRAVNNQGDFFDRTAFSYEPQTDTFRCPAGRTLVRKQVLTRKRSILYVAEDCSDCALKPRCTRVERRFVRRHLYEDALERMNARVEADPGLMRQRRCTAEHPFGTIKRMTAGGRFLTRGLNKVKAETALSVLAYNILRTINLVGASGLRASLA